MKKIIFLMLFAGEMGNVWSGWEWQVEEVTTFDHIVYAMTVEDGRNDTVNRLYIWCGNDSIGIIKELTYSNGVWQSVNVCSLSSPIRGMTFAKGRRDDTTRLYVVADSTLLEFTYYPDGWKLTSSVKYTAQLQGLLAGPGRGDDTLRIYCGVPTPSAPQPGKIIEFTWEEDKWQITSEFEVWYFNYPVAIAKGRNDDTTRLYCAVLEGSSKHYHGMEEWVYSENGWKKTSEICEYYVLGFPWMMGDGRSDGIIRIYGTYTDIIENIYGIIEYTYSEGKWKYEVIDDLFSYGCVAVGDGRNDGKNSIFFSNWKSLYEYRWEEDHWEFTQINLPEGFIFSEEDLLDSKTYHTYRNGVIGRGRNDDTNRVYYTYNKRVWEATYRFLGIEEEKEDKKVLSFLVYPNPFRDMLVISWKSEKEPVKIEIYNAAGEKVKGFKEVLKERIIWKGKDDKGNFLPSGVYFCQLQVGNKKYTKKIILQR